MLLVVSGSLTRKGADQMARKRMTVVRFEEVKRLIGEGLSDRAIMRALRCRREKVAEIRKGTASDPGRPKAIVGPLWTEQVSWAEVITELSLGHPLKLIHEEKASHLTTYSNFWKQFYRRYPALLKASVTLREFAPGERAEVDYAGDTIPWLDLKTKRVHHAYVFVGTLGFSQFFFAHATGDMKSTNWLHSHRRMFEAFGGVPHVLVPDCLKQGVSKCHLYDPDLNPSYAELAAHYRTAIVPARPKHPKDKALVEGAVKIIMRYFKWLNRRRTFTSLSEINQALREVVAKINGKPRTRFKISRRERFEKVEFQKLKPLPEFVFDAIEWRQAILHPDSHIAVESACYSAPYIHRGKKLRVKLTEFQVEIYLDLERFAIHVRDRQRLGNRVTNTEHLPPNSRAYREATPQHLLSQARFVSPSLHVLLDELFTADTMGNLRRAQGFIRAAVREINETGREPAVARIGAAIDQMRRFNKIRVSYFTAQLTHLRKTEAHANTNSSEREIIRQPNNPMIRYTRTASGDQGEFPFGAVTKDER